MASIPLTAIERDHPASRPAPPLAAPGQRYSAARLSAFGSLEVPAWGAELAIALFVPQIYASHYGIPLAALGIILFLVRLWSVATDPIVGALSDRSRTRFGRRKPWIASGGLLFGLASIALFFPPTAPGPLYLAATLFVYTIGWTMIGVPSWAWAGEVSGDYHERTRIMTYQQVLRSIGLLLILVLPTLMDRGSAAVPNAKLHVSGAFVLATLLPTLLLTLSALPEPALPSQSHHRIGFWRTATIVFRDRLLLRVLASDLAVTAGQSIRAGLIAFFCISYMGLAQWASGLYLLQFVFGVVAGPLWLAIGRRLGKRETAITGELVQAAINIGLLAVFPDTLWLLVALAVAQGLTQASGNLMLRAMVADVADAHELATGHNRTGLFFSVFSLASKAGPAIGIGLALPLLAWVGFRPGGHSAPAALEALKYVFALGPAAAHIISAALIWHFPLDQTRHAAIRRALDTRAASVPVEA